MVSHQELQVMTLKTMKQRKQGGTNGGKRGTNVDKRGQTGEQTGANGDNRGKGEQVEATETKAAVIKSFLRAFTQ